MDEYFTILMMGVLHSIKEVCAENNDDCMSCPFNIIDNWHDYCLFMGGVPNEGTIPEFWELDKIKWDFKEGLNNG